MSIVHNFGNRTGLNGFLLSIIDHMKPQNWKVSPETLWAHSWNGAIRVMTLEKLGVHSSTAYRRCIEGGPWQRVLPGIVLLHSGQPTRDQLVAAALLYGGPAALVTGLEACRRHGQRQLPHDLRIHLLVPSQRKLHSSDYVVVERTKYLPKPVMRDGFPLAPHVRAVLDAGRRIREFSPVRDMLVEAVDRGCGPFSMLTELNTGSQRGTAVPRRLLRDEVCDDVRSVAENSVAESEALLLWQRAGLPEPLTATTLFDEREQYVTKPDFWCQEYGFAWQITSATFRHGQQEYEKSAERKARFRDAGIVVLQTHSQEIRNSPRAVIKALRHESESARRKVTTKILIEHQQD